LFSKDFACSVRYRILALDDWRMIACVNAVFD
jgi:hypothetical protein